MGGDDMKEFSDYEERMISFLMGYGMSTELAEQSIIDERLDQFNDIDHQLTDENQKRNIAPMTPLWIFLHKKTALGAVWFFIRRLVRMLRN